MSGMSYMKSSPDLLDAFLTVCRKHGVTKYSDGEFSVELAAVPSVPEISTSELKNLLEKENADTVQENMDILSMEDPLKYEELVAQGELVDAESES